jgi:hypothetical protein
MSTKTKKNTIALSQNQLVINYLRTARRRNLTSEEICEGVNGILKSTRGRKLSPLTTEQVRKCLTKFSERNMVKRVDRNGLHSNGRIASRWTYVRS